MIDRRRIEAISKRTPDDEFLARGNARQRRGEAAVDGIDEVGVSRLAIRPREHVVHGQRPGQQRVGAVGDPQHHELAGHGRRGDRRRLDPDPPHPLGDRAMVHDRYPFVAGMVGMARA